VPQKDLENFATIQANPLVLLIIKLVDIVLIISNKKMVANMLKPTLMDIAIV